MNLDALLEPVSGRDTQPCKIGRIVLGLEEPYKSALANLLATTYNNGGESDSQVRNRLLKAGFSVSAPVIYRHRHGQCACESVVNG